MPTLTPGKSNNAMDQDRTNHRRARGFTLIELIVTTFLLVLLFGISAPYLGTVLGVQVRGAARQLAGTLRQVFDESVIRSSNYRVVFNLDRHSYSVELCSSDSGVLYRNSSEREAGEEAVAERMRRLEQSARSESAQVPLADSLLKSCTQVSDPALAPVNLEDPVTLLGVWTPQYPSVQRGSLDGPTGEPDEDAKVTVNFIKSGYAERAFIYLSDGSEDSSDVYTLEIEPLTGQVILHDGEVEVPREYWR